MDVSQTLFAQLMDFLPWTSFTRIVKRYDGDHRVRTLRCTAHFQVMAFAQLTYRESLRDIEACLSAQFAKLFRMGLRGPIPRSTLADANERRDWRIYAEFAEILIHLARRLYGKRSTSTVLTRGRMSQAVDPSPRSDRSGLAANFSFQSRGISSST